MCLGLSSPKDACQKRKIKGTERKTLTLCIKLKDRLFAQGSRGFHALICLYAQPLSAKERHVILPIVIATFIMKLSLLFFAITSSYNAQFSLRLNDPTLLEAIFIALLHQ